MSNRVQYTASCGCSYGVDVYHDWVDEITGVEDVWVEFTCETHRNIRAKRIEKAAQAVIEATSDGVCYNGRALAELAEALKEREDE